MSEYYDFIQSIGRTTMAKYRLARSWHRVAFNIKLKLDGLFILSVCLIALIGKIQNIIKSRKALQRQNTELKEQLDEERRQNQMLEEELDASSETVHFFRTILPRHIQRNAELKERLAGQSRRLHVLEERLINNDDTVNFYATMLAAHRDGDLAYLNRADGNAPNHGLNGGDATRATEADRYGSVANEPQNHVEVDQESLHAIITAGIDNLAHELHGAYPVNTARILAEFEAKAAAQYLQVLRSTETVEVQHLRKRKLSEAFPSEWFEKEFVF